MKSGKLGWIEIYSWYLQQCLLINLFSYWTSRVLWIRSVLLSRSFLEISSLNFSATQHGVKGPYGVMAEMDFSKKIFCSQKWAKQVKPRVLWMYMKIQLFFFLIWFIIVYINLVYTIKVYINCYMFGKILENVGSWDMCQNVLGQSDCRIFK